MIRPRSPAAQHSLEVPPVSFPPVSVGSFQAEHPAFHSAGAGIQRTYPVLDESGSHCHVHDFSELKRERSAELFAFCFGSCCLGGFLARPTDQPRHALQNSRTSVENQYTPNDFNEHLFIILSKSLPVKIRKNLTSPALSCVPGLYKHGRPSDYVFPFLVSFRVVGDRVQKLIVGVEDHAILPVPET